MLWNQLSAVTLLTSLLDPRPCLEGSYKIGSVCQFVFLSVLPLVRKLSWDWLISFFWNLTCVRGQYIVVCDRAGFFGKNPHRAKVVKKWPKNMGFGLFKKIVSLVLSGICVKWKFLWFINILRKLHAWEKSGSQVIAKNVSRPMRF